MPMQTGDIKSTLADNKLLFNLTGYKPRVSVEEEFQILLIGI